MTRAAAPYMEWAKTRPRPAIDLAGSNLHGCTLDDLPGARDAIDIAGESPDGYPPLVEAIAARYGVGADNVATANGCSGANFLACAALLEPGDEVLVEKPFYDPMPAAARLLGASVITFERRFEDGYDVDADRVAAALTPRTRLVLLSNPHNPSGALARPESLAALAALASRRGIHVLVDEVYLDTVFADRPVPAATLSPALVSTNSLTKSYGLASLRCGWTLAAPDVTRRIRRARDLVDVWAPMPSDRLSVVAFAEPRCARGPGPRDRGGQPRGGPQLALRAERPRVRAFAGDDRVSPAARHRRRLGLRRAASHADRHGRGAGPFLRLSGPLSPGLRRSPGPRCGRPRRHLGDPGRARPGLTSVTRRPTVRSFHSEPQFEGGGMPDDKPAQGGADYTQWHEVKSGETLSKIAQHYYGDASLYPKIFEANKDTLKDPNMIRVGQKFRIP